MSFLRPTFILAAALLCAAGAASNAYAQSATPTPATSTSPLSFTGAIASTYSISDGDVRDGDIISLNEQSRTFALSRAAYDENVFGIAVSRPAIVFRGGAGEVPVVQSGRARVNVSTLNGPVQEGDPITTSPVPGVGQRADYGRGTVLGFALEPFTASAASETVSYEGEEYGAGQVLTAINIREYAAEPTDEQPGDTETGGGLGESSFVDVLRYMIAGAIALLSLYTSYSNFGSNIAKGVESIGRNPLARRSIQLTVAFNVILLVVVSVLGLAMSAVIALYPF